MLDHSDNSLKVCGNPFEVGCQRDKRTMLRRIKLLKLGSAQ